MMMSEFSRAELFRDRARELRGKAGRAPSDLERKQIELIAAEYDLLARKVEDGTLPS